MAGTFFGGVATHLEQFVVAIPTIATTSRIQYVGNGVTKQYSITWPYLNAAHVFVLVGGVIQGSQLWSFINTTTIQLNTAPQNGLLVELRRTTPQATLVTYTNGAVLTSDDLNLATLQALYLIQEFNDLYGAGLNNALTKVAGYSGPVTVSPAEMIAAVSDQVLSSNLVASLNTRISDIDTNATAILNNAIRIDGVQAIIDSLTGVGGVSTIIATETASRIAGDSALQTQLTLLGAMNGTNTAFILDVNKTYVDSVTSLSSRLSGLDAYNATNAAGIVTEQTARISGDTANASSITSLTSTVSGHTASIATNATTVNGLSAQYTVKVDVNGRVSGYGLASTATTAGVTSAFVVIANQFSIVDPGSTGSAPIVPFSVVSGVVYMQNVVITNAIIQDAAITSAKIANLSVGTAQMVDNSSGQVSYAYNSVSASFQATPFTPSLSTVLSVAAVCTGAPVALDISCPSILMLQSGGPTSLTATYEIYRDGSLSANSPIVNHTYSNVVQMANGNSYAPPVNLTFIDASPSPGTHTYALTLYLDMAGPVGSKIIAQTRYTSIKLREYKK